MHRRAFLKAGFALPTIAVMSTLPRFTQANTEGAGKWRVFEVTTQVEILKPVGVTRVWLPIPLMQDTPYQKSLGNTWKAEGAMASMTQDAKSGAAFIFAEWPEAVQNPTLQLTSRVATRDYTVDPHQTRYHAQGGCQTPRPVYRANRSPANRWHCPGYGAKDYQGYARWASRASPCHL